VLSFKLDQACETC